MTNLIKFLNTIPGHHKLVVYSHALLCEQYAHKEFKLGQPPIVNNVGPSNMQGFIIVNGVQIGFHNTVLETLEILGKMNAEKNET